MAVASILSVGGCGPEEDLPPGLLGRDTFVEVYVALRMHALQTSDANLPEAERDSILAEYDVDPDDLVAFAEAHGRDPEYMVEVWRDIEGRLNIPVDSTAEDSN
jgi:hypothetical protein